MNAEQIIERVQKRSGNVCANCNHPETVEAIVVDGDVVELYCWNIVAFVRPLSRCDQWEKRDDE